MTRGNIFTIVLLIFVATVVVGFAFYQYLLSNKDVFEKDAAIADGNIGAKDNKQISEPEAVVREFFEWYRQDGNRLPNDAYETSDLLTDDFKKELGKRPRGAHEVALFCGLEDRLGSLNVATNVRDATTANVSIWIESTNNEPTLRLNEMPVVAELIVTENESWKIKNISCLTI